jgi:hypothetical protein
VQRPPSYSLQLGEVSITITVVITTVRPDPGGAFDDSKLNGFGCFSPSDKVSDWIADRLAEGSAGIGAWEVNYSALVSSPRWHRAIIS